MSTSNKYEVVNYSEKAIAVFFASTKDAVIQGYDDLMTQMGGKKNPSLKGLNPTDPKREGYIFSIKRKAEVEKALASHSHSPSSVSAPVQAVTTKSTFLSASQTAEKLIQALSARVEALESQLDALQRIVTSGGSGGTGGVTTAIRKKKVTPVQAMSDDEMEEDDSTATFATTATPSLIVRRK